MNTEQTFDGKTAGFIAVVANSINRSTPEERMQELMSPGGIVRMKMLLTPLLHDDWIDLLPAVSENTIRENHIHPRLRWFEAWQMHREGKSSFKFRSVLEKAHTSEYVFLSYARAEHFCRLLVSAWTPAMPTCYFLWADCGKWLKVWTHDRAGHAYSRDVDVNLVERCDANTKFFFADRWDTRIQGNAAPISFVPPT